MNSNGDLEEICKKLKELVRNHAIETARLNFALGDLHNEYVTRSGLSGIEVGKRLAEISGFGARTFETNARASRRLPSAVRPSNLGWGVIKYFALDMSPSKLNMDEQLFKSVLAKIIADADVVKLEHGDLEKPSTFDADTTLAQEIIDRHA